MAKRFKGLGLGKQKSGKVSDANKKQLREDLFCGQTNVDIPSSRKRKGMVPLVISSVQKPTFLMVWVGISAYRMGSLHFWKRSISKIYTGFVTSFS